MARVQFKTNGGVANGDSISSAFDSNVTLGNKIIVRVGSYNTAAITAGHCTDSQGNTYALDVQQKRTSDGFSVAILSATVGSAAACTVTVNVDGNNYYALYIEEWSGLGTVRDSATGEGSSTAPSCGTNTLSAAVDGVAFGMMTHASATTSIAVGSGWTQDSELESNDTTLTYSAMSRSTTASTTYTADWTLGGSSSWIAASVIYSVVPSVMTAWNRTGGGTQDVPTDTLSFSDTPQVGGTVVVTVSLWSSTVSGFSNQGITPTNLMVTDNQGGASGDYSAARVMLATTGRTEAGGNINTPGVGVFYRRVTAPVSGTFTVTFDIDPSSTGEGYWTWSILYLSDIISASPVDDSSEAFLPATLGGPTPTSITCGTSTSSTDKTVAIYHMHNGGHEGDADVSDPTGYTAVAHNEENSAYLSGHSGYKLLSATGDETPTMAITRNDGPSITYCRGVLVIFKREGGVVPGRASKNTRPHPLGIGLGMKRGFAA